MQQNNIPFPIGSQDAEMLDTRFSDLDRDQTTGMERLSALIQNFEIRVHELALAIMHLQTPA